MMENKETTTVSLELTAEQYAFLTNWQKKHEKELGIEIPITALIHKAVDCAMQAENRPARPEREDRPPRRDDARSFGPRRDGPPRGRPGSDRGDRPEGGRSFGSRDGGSRSFGSRDGGGRPGGRPGFGARPAFNSGSRGPKFDMSDSKRKRTKTFDKE